LIQTQPERAIEVVKQIQNVKDERKRIAEKYADLLKQDTGASQQMNSTLKYFDEVFGRFDKAATDYAARAPAEIDRGIGETTKINTTAPTKRSSSNSSRKSGPPTTSPATSSPPASTPATGSAPRDGNTPTKPGRKLTTAGSRAS